MSRFVIRKPVAGMLVAGLVGVFALTGCSMDTRTSSVVTQEPDTKIVLQEDVWHAAFETSSLTDEDLLGFQGTYQRYGVSPVTVAVTYDPESKTDTAMRATDAALLLSKRLKKAGVRDVETQILPVPAQDKGSQTLLAYRMVTAEAPPGCHLMGGIEGRETKADRDYIHGCSMEMLLARQIYRPADLAGNDARGDFYGSRVGNMTRPYVFGLPNPAMAGLLASDQ
ncbi:MAG: hypothetical protein KDJ15_03690 [Alphaproteobacteria bacterium]|nr:hypothetical protein [Alphaproteobacteria bacterium]